jgi:hypothetical protein
MYGLTKQNDNELKDCFVKIVLTSNSSYTGHFIECTEHGFIGILTENISENITNSLASGKRELIKRETIRLMYFPKESIRSIEFIIDKW